MDCKAGTEHNTISITNKPVITPYLSINKMSGLGSCDQLPIRMKHKYHKETMNQKWKAQQHQLNNTWLGYNIYPLVYRLATAFCD